MRDMMVDMTDVVPDEDEGIGGEIGAIQQAYGVDYFTAEKIVETNNEYPDDESQYKSENGEDVYDRDLVDHVDWQKVEANHSRCSFTSSQRDSKDTQEYVHALGDPEEDIGKRTKPPFDYVNPQRLSDLVTLGFSDVQIAQTLSVSPESVERARSLYL
jgi:hypothetical protein